MPHLVGAGWQQKVSAMPVDFDGPGQGQVHAVHGRSRQVARCWQDRQGEAHRAQGRLSRPDAEQEGRQAASGRSGVGARDGGGSGGGRGARQQDEEARGAP
eukprot:1343632-Pyramimonas_sp.AAC.1